MISIVVPAYITLDGRRIPWDFPYINTLLHGRPTHEGDEFYYRHPPMEQGKRAKIFAPFDALDGHSNAICRKERRYAERRILSEEEQFALNRKLNRLSELCPNSKAARDRKIVLRVRYFQANDLPATDWRAGQGDYVEQIGVLQYISLTEQYLIVGGLRIWFGDIEKLRCLKER